jgi:hypothetical protein
VSAASAIPELGVVAFPQLKHANVDAHDVPLIDPNQVGAGGSRP